MNEYEKMIRGYWYDANFDTALIAMRLRAEELCFRFNHTSPAKTEERQRILNELLPHMQEQVTILSPFYVDYGAHCQIGEGTFLNHNAYLMDGGRITIGARCFIGPNCGIYTARHPLCSDERNQGLEQALPVTIGDDVWIGADVTILPGITIGTGAVIGAKSLVTRDVPPHTLAMGHPCRNVRPIQESDRIRKDPDPQ